jgi:ABC-type branched-subunit amino acid transport system ATPase component/ABC-type branched-subunit amino acid transport system permease subunit
MLLAGIFDWNFTLPFIDFDVPANIVILGLITGLTYALTGVGLTLVFRTSRVLNLAAGEMGALPALLIPILVINHGWPYWPTLVISLAAAALLGGLIEFLVIRRLHRATRLTAMVATIGIAQVLFGITFIIPRAGELTGKQYPTPFNWRLSTGPLVLGPGQLLIAIVVPLSVIGLTWFLRRSRIGRASRASAENAEAAQLAGVPTSRVAFVVWSLAGLLAGLGAILIGPTRPLTITAALGPSLLLRALGAAMIGGLASFGWTFAGGIAIGVIEALILFNYPTGGVLEVVLSLLIIGCLLLKPSLSRAYRSIGEGSWTREGYARALPPTVAREPRVRALRWGTLVLVLALAICAPLVLTPSNQFLLTSVLMIAMVGVSLVVLTGYSGNVSLGQWAFVGVGAAIGGRLYQLGWPHVPAALATVLCGSVIALLIGLPALRIRGLFLAVTTLGFALTVSSWLFNQRWLVERTGGAETSLELPRPVLFGIDFADQQNYYWLCLAIFILVAFVVYRLRRTGLGRAMVAVRDNEPSAASLSLSPRRVKLTAFMISGAIASLAGFLYGAMQVNFSVNPLTTFGPDKSLDVMVTAVFGGVGSITGVVLGAAWIEGIPRILGQGYALVSSGFGLLLVLVLLPGGLASIVFDVRDKIVERIRRPAPPPEPAVEPGRPAAVAVSTHQAAATDGPAAALPVRAIGITVNFGGLRALDDVSIEARPGEVLGLMGPNGAGKTTLFDVLTGQLRANHGDVYLDGVEVGHLAPHRRARLGVGRTYQQARLFAELTATEAIEVALERRLPTHTIPSLVGLPSSRRRERRAAADAAEIVELLDLQPYAHRAVGELPTGVRRLVELGCVVALDADLLLLDEPTAGFTHREVQSFARVIGEVREYLGATVVVIDHDVPMMRTLVDRLYVLATGRIIAEGPPSLLDTDQAVADAYLGTPVGVA